MKSPEMGGQTPEKERDIEILKDAYVEIDVIGYVFGSPTRQKGTVAPTGKEGKFSFSGEVKNLPAAWSCWRNTPVESTRRTEYPRRWLKATQGSITLTLGDKKPVTKKFGLGVGFQPETILAEAMAEATGESYGRWIGDCSQLFEE